ncbi:MAG: HNH endonuclease signature motif containing protein [Bifidobacterium crudilactis]|jgi:5-methylcytosine-specific restriction endonuclease McrA
MKRTNPRNTNGARRRAIRARVIAAYDTCAICGKPVDKTLRTPNPWSAEVDEIIPVSKGGSPFDFANVQLTHRRCNQLKSNKTTTWAQQALKGKNIKPTSIPFQTSDW